MGIKKRRAAQPSEQRMNWSPPAAARAGGFPVGWLYVAVWGGFMEKKYIYISLYFVLWWGYSSTQKSRGHHFSVWAWNIQLVRGWIQDMSISWRWTTHGYGCFFSILKRLCNIYIYTHIYYIYIYLIYIYRYIHRSPCLISSCETRGVLYHQQNWRYQLLHKRQSRMGADDMSKLLRLWVKGTTPVSRCFKLRLHQVRGMNIVLSWERSTDG